MANTIYFDNSATTAVDTRVVEAMLPYFNSKYGNASSIHVEGRIVHSDLDVARTTIAKFLNCAPQGIVFMGTGTEANNYAIMQTAKYYKKIGKGNHIITTKIEHNAILNTVQHLEKEEGFTATYLPVDGKGQISLTALKDAITDKTILISIMMANNEVGTIYPIKEAAKIAKERNITFHCDAVQAVGKVKIDIEDLGVDMLTISGHKIYAPKGIGVLYIREDLRCKLTPLVHGGGQEKNTRSGTENIPYIMGLAKAVEIIMEDNYKEAKELAKLRDHFEKRVLAEIPHTTINGDKEHRVATISNITFKYIEAESIIGYVPEVACSLGSACNAGSDGESHVLTAMGIDPIDIHGTMRFSFGRFNTLEDIDKAVDLLKVGVDKLRQMSPLYEQACS